MINLMRKIKNYIDKLVFLRFKMRQHISYSLSFRDLRDSNHKIREVAHSLDKASKLDGFDKLRGKKAKKQLEELLSNTTFVSIENQKLIDKINGGNNFIIDDNVVLPTIRNFKSEIVISDYEIEEVIELANKYPKSCSRETVKVYLKKDGLSELSSCFNGFSCFEEDSTFYMAVIVVDLCGYDQRAEIFAPYIDGAIFSTGFARELWSKGYGSCMLNWSSQSIQQEKKLRALLGLSKFELVIMGIVFGVPKKVDNHAPRKPVESILKLI